ncbi:sterol desaturase family protein [Altererythrobacter ishigakiensis]|uniref:C-5 sterol desaturase n=1 Tax=Altererythrobacter ishigakiensis TaxID=476157 RepID=A0A562UT22_9SPHN|nr:sterol desaturase family protein [Altererythrobacter ishigakiensis]TWJ08759.1 C-5 sterol desaturase [Altererythrobacter ishigakiensis]
MVFGLMFAAVSMTLIVALRYLISSGMFAWITVRLRPGQHDGLKPQIRREIKWSLASAAIYGVPAGLAFWSWRHLGWTHMYLDPLDYPVWYMPLSALIYLFAHDTWFYWTHRAMHWPVLFRLAHSVHHNSRPPTAWAAMSFHPIEALSGAIVIPALVLLVPIHMGILGLVLAVMTIMGVTNHMGWEMFPRWLVHSRFGKWVITASHHERHHEEYQCNYGLYFRFWDKVCGTDRGLTTRFAQ